jgi:hypothetical protein
MKTAARLATTTVVAAAAAAVIGVAPNAAALPGRFANPMQPYASADGEVHLLRPILAAPTRDRAPLGSLMSPGWRLIWDGSTVGTGEMVVRLVLKVRPAAGQPGTASEVLQIGRSRDPRVVRTCLTFGLRSGAGRRLPDRTINGRRYAAWENNDAGMSQSIAALDLRAVVNGACYAIARFRYGETASDGDRLVRLTSAQGAALLDKSLDSLQLGSVPAWQVVRPQTVSVPAGAVAW